MLKKLQTHSGYGLHATLNGRVGHTSNDNVDTVDDVDSNTLKHRQNMNNHPLLSLDNSCDANDVDKWLQRACKELLKDNVTASAIDTHNNISMSPEPKLDGSSSSLNHVKLNDNIVTNDYKLELASTRVNGCYGEDDIHSK